MTWTLTVTRMWAATIAGWAFLACAATGVAYDVRVTSVTATPGASGVAVGADAVLDNGAEDGGGIYVAMVRDARSCAQSDPEEANVDVWVSGDVISREERTIEPGPVQLRRTVAAERLTPGRWWVCAWARVDLAGQIDPATGTYREVEEAWAVGSTSVVVASTARISAAPPVKGNGEPAAPPSASTAGAGAPSAGRTPGAGRGRVARARLARDLRATGLRPPALRRAAPRLRADLRSLRTGAVTAADRQVVQVGDRLMRQLGRPDRVVRRDAVALLNAVRAADRA